MGRGGSVIEEDTDVKLGNLVRKKIGERMRQRAQRIICGYSRK